jgi:hypothetical protein
LDNAFKNPLGWDNSLEPTPDANEAHFKAQMKEIFDLNMAIYQTFNSKSGKKILAWLRKATIEAATWMPSIARQSGIDAANAHAYAREGQNALVRDLERRIDIAMNCESPDEIPNYIKENNL